MEKRAKVTRLVFEHVERADDAVKNFRDNGVSAEGVLMHPQFQAAELKVAREELRLWDGARVSLQQTLTGKRNRASLPFGPARSELQQGNQRSVVQ